MADLDERRPRAEEVSGLGEELSEEELALVVGGGGNGMGAGNPIED